MSNIARKTYVRNMVTEKGNRKGKLYLLINLKFETN